MLVTPTTFTIAEYCDQMKAKAIIVNPDYQRSPKIWPQSARSYLIDTILSGYPMPKLTLYQTTDLKTRKTIKEIVDGQQRSQAILDFFDDKLRVSGKGDFAGKLFRDLSEEKQHQFLNYAVSVDLVVGATGSEIRQMFRRINSYTIPLNAQEKRHAVYQGEFKWFIVDLTEQYDDTLKNIGVFTERQLSRMLDADLLSEIIYALDKGIESASDAKLDKFYKENDDRFEKAQQYKARVDQFFSRVLTWRQIHHGQLMKPFSFYSLALAISHILEPVPALEKVFESRHGGIVDDEKVLWNLGSLAASLEEPKSYPSFSDFVEACSKTTDRVKNRTTRFVWLCRALTQHKVA